MRASARPEPDCPTALPLKHSSEPPEKEIGRDSERGVAADSCCVVWGGSPAVTSPHPALRRAELVRLPEQHIGRGQGQRQRIAMQMGFIVEKVIEDSARRLLCGRPSGLAPGTRAGTARRLRTVPIRSRRPYLPPSGTTTVAPPPQPRSAARRGAARSPGTLLFAWRSTRDRASRRLLAVCRPPSAFRRRRGSAPLPSR